MGLIQIDMPMPEKCEDCIFCGDSCSCVASEYDGLGINVGCAFRTGRRDIRCPLKEQPEIVRCKDCKAWKQYDDMNLGGCELYPEYNKMGDWFCNFGERKEGR